ncbi:MAG: DUF6075 family protein [Enterococcus sp.]
MDFENRSIRPKIWFNGELSGGDTRLLALAFNLFITLDYYELEDGKRYYISPLEIFTGIDERGYKLAKNALDVRLMPNFILNAEATE